MCTRFSLTAPPDEVADVFGLAEVPDLVPRYNIAPSQPLACVRGDRRGRWLTMLRWGLIPSWANDLKIGHDLVNARAETIAEKPAFRAAFRYRRCLVPADGFYQWEHRGTTKIPYHIRLRYRSLFALAGLWETWTDLFGDAVETCCVITTGANAAMPPGRDRMPAVIDPADFGRWLDPAEPVDELAPLLRPYPAVAFEAVPASTMVNSPANEGPHLLSTSGQVASAN
jgi:putative SOS response-associated peptidase YedK